MAFTQVFWLLPSGSAHVLLAQSPLTTQGEPNVLSQLPPPLQVRLLTLRQVWPFPYWGSSSYFGTLSQKPKEPGRSHALQAPVHVELQQTPSAQTRAPVQSFSVLHFCPCWHGTHRSPPQSRSDSSPFWTPSVQLKQVFEILSQKSPLGPQSASVLHSTQFPSPSQLFPFPTLQGVPCAAGMLVGAPPTHDES